MSYIKKKISILSQLGITVTDAQQERMFSMLCDSESLSQIRIDNFVRSIIMS